MPTLAMASLSSWPVLVPSAPSVLRRRLPQTLDSMEITDLSAIEQDSLLRTLNYCVAQWDWESPTLFSLEQSDFQALISTWPQCIALQEKTAALAVVGGLREILYGSAVKS